MIERLPKWAEVAIELQCIAAGAIVHPPEDDQNGWDYLVEFPPEKHPGPPDTHPAAKSAFIQIKSKKSGKPSCRVTLSNALKSAQSMQPWFLVLMVAGNDETKPTIYVAHLWEPFIREALKAVRMAHNQGKQLNHCTIAIPFSAPDRHDDDLVSWIHRTIAAYGPNYAQKKQKLYRDLGYEDGAYVGTITVNAPSLDEIAKNFLGLGDGLSLSEFIVSKSRFGLVSPIPDVSFTGGGILFVEPNPVGACEVRLRASNVSYSLSGQIFAFGDPIVPKEERRVRFSAEFFELVTAKGLQYNFKTHLDIDSKKPLPTLEAFSAVSDCFQKGMPVDLQVWARDQRVTTGTILKKAELTANWGRLLEIIRKMREVPNADSAELSLNDIVATGKPLAAFVEVLSAKQMRMEFEPTSVGPSEIDYMIFYSIVEVGDNLFFALGESKLTSDVTIDNRRRLDFGPTNVVDSYVIVNPTQAHREQAQNNYQRYVEMREQKTRVITIGEVWAFSQSTQIQSDAGQTSA